MGIYILNFRLNFHCVIIHRNTHTGIECLLEKVLQVCVCQGSFKIPVPNNKLLISQKRNTFGIEGFIVFRSAKQKKIPKQGI